MSFALRKEPGRLNVALASGAMLQLDGIVLYPSEILAKSADFRASASRKMGGVSTGLGFIGSPGWAIGAGAALGLIEGALSGSAKKEAIKFLKIADDLRSEALANGVTFRVADIDHIDQPNPAAWYATRETRASGGILQREKILSQTYCHSGEEFIHASAAGTLLHIRWSTVAAYVSPL